MREVISIKIRGKFVAFNEDDRFMDNGACVQCLTHNGFYCGLGRYAKLLMTKKAMAEIDSACENVLVKSDYPDSIKIFKLRLRA